MLLFFLASALVSCQEAETLSEFTGNEAVYALQQASPFAISGTVSFKEKKDGSALVLVQLEGTDGDVKLPVHLHWGDISTPGAEVVALLSPVNGLNGRSETQLKMLADETTVTYKDMLNYEASIKVHLSDVGPERDIVLAAGNIGKIATTISKNGRLGVGVCKSE